MTTLRPVDVAVESLARRLTHAPTAFSATTFHSPSWGYAVPRESSRCRIPLDEQALSRVTANVARHRVELAQTGCCLWLALDGPAIEAALVDVSYDQLGARQPAGAAPTERLPAA